MSNFNGSWRNQRGSTLELVVDRHGIVTGRFESGVGDKGQMLWVDVTGRAQDNLVTFNALWPSFGTVVTWAGQHSVEDGCDRIAAHWIHVTNVDDAQEQAWMWYANRIGFDVFARNDV